PGVPVRRTVARRALRAAAGGLHGRRRDEQLVPESVLRYLASAARAPRLGGGLDRRRSRGGRYVIPLARSLRALRRAPTPAAARESGEATCSVPRGGTRHAVGPRRTPSA